MEESRNSDTTPEPADTPAAGFYVVGIGASAGGLAALRTLFSSMPASPGIACVVVVHLSPEHESHLVPLLQPYTQMPVQQVTQTLAIEPNHVYVIPPNANLNSIDTHLRLSQLEERRVERAPIDHFLRTLATTHDGASIGVILTGAGSDGALGLRQIKEHGGLTVAQDPQEAEYDSMPRNAIATGMVEVVAPLRDIPAEILRFCTTQPRLPALDADGGIDQADAVALENIIGILERRTGRDFHVYTHAILLKRIRHRMQVRHLDSLGSYLDLLHEQHQEAHELSNDLLLTVTEFFREPEVYEQLQQRVLPGLLDRKQNPGDRLRVWSIGCSTGEEAYSLAMLAMEQTAQRDIHPHLQIFASDLADEMLHRAREGAYPREVAASVSAERLERFFTKDIGYYGVRREVRDAVVFASHNLFKDPPYSHLDLIVCRNLLRDLQPDIRIGVIRLFHYALEPHGLLVLGPGDDAPDPDLFVPEVAADGIYRRRTGPRRPLLLPAGVRPFGADHPYVELPGLPGVAPVQPHATVHRQAIEPHTPASVLVDAGNKIVHFSSRAWTFLRIPGGELTHDVVRLAQPPLRSHLEDGLVVVRKERRAWMSPVLIADTDHGPRHVVIRVEPIRPVDVQELVLVIFDELLAGTRTDLADAAAAAAATAAARLGVGLERTNQKLRVLVGQTEGGRTDDAAEAGGLDSNELRTVMEELESSREELQAVNEELLTVDRENRRRIEQLAQLSNDLHQLLQSTGIATLFLDTGLRIVRFTPPIAELFNVRVGDIGRSLSDFTHGLLYDDLIGDARRVQETDARLEREVEAANGRWYLARMLPYQMEADQGDGVVLTLVDITERRRAEEELREADRRKDEFLAVLSHELRNPLAPIASGIELLKSAGRDDLEIVERVVPMMARQVRHLVRLVDDLLEVSRIRGGRLKLQRAPVLLGDIVRDAVASVAPQVERATQELTVDVPREPVLLDADAARLTQVLANLLNNASRYTPRGGGITVTAERDGAMAVLRVRDNGFGMREDVASRVFDLFYRGSDPHQTADGGLGIGLAISRQLVEMHGGTLTGTSAGPDRGSEFTIKVPVSPDEFVLVPQRGRRRRDLAGHRVLVVDDNRDAAEALSLQVKAMGVEDVQMALSGEGALQSAAAFSPDVVLLDLGMPGMDGLEVARRMRQEPWGKGVVLIAVTGWGQDEHRQRTREAGFDRHLTKPVDRAALEEVLASPGPPG